MNNAIFSLLNIRKNYKQGNEQLEIIKGASLEISPGELVAMLGPSGSGKSTLLQIAGLLDRADSGVITIAGKDCSKLNDSGRTRIRRESLGFVYQMHHLLPEFSALENVMVPQMIAGTSYKNAASQAKEMLGLLGLSARLHHRPAALSGGEQQRVAIARAMANNPAILLADEPTGNLDPHTSDEVFALFMKAARELDMAALIVTHNTQLAASLDRVVKLEEGILVEQDK